MTKINVEKIEEVIENLCCKAAVKLDKDTYNRILLAYGKENNTSSKEVLAQILQNAKLSAELERPLCQDTGQVVVFLEIGQNIQFVGGNLSDSINKGVSSAYIKNSLRKSIVKTPFSRENSLNNCPAVIHTEIVDGDELSIKVGLKGGGAENMSSLKMMSPSLGIKGVFDFVVDTVRQASLKACPPMIIGVGVGGNLETSAIKAKKALFENKKQKTKLEKELIIKLNELNIGASGKGGDTTVLDVNIIETPCHIASMPVAVNLNCHSSRHASAKILKDEIKYDFEKFEYEFVDVNSSKLTREVFTSDVEIIRNLQEGEKILLSGIVYTARDEAHKRLLEDSQKPIDVENAIIFYAGPCPAKDNEIIGPVGPTTSIRMDKYTNQLLERGLLAAIGKGERTKEVEDGFHDKRAIYFNATGGTATLLAQCVKESELVAYEDLGPEAIYKLRIEKLPLAVAYGRIDGEKNNNKY